jgi:hypothetical protein
MSRNSTHPTSLLKALRRRFSELGQAIKTIEDIAEQKLEERTLTYGRAHSLVALSETLETRRPPGYKSPAPVVWTKPDATTGASKATSAMETQSVT